MEKVLCVITKNYYDITDCYRFDDISIPLANLILRDFPAIKQSDYISVEQVAQYRKKYLSNLIEDEHGKIDLLEKHVIDTISKDKLLSENIEPDFTDSLTLGQRLADKIALFGGSWTFILSFFFFIALWMVINIVFLSTNAYDPYPFILLNLILSCLAAIQAPIIMMSQNRKEHKDRVRSENDYKINLKAELEIKMLHEKVDHLMIHQNKKLLEIQELQVDFFEDAIKLLKNKST